MMVVEEKEDAKKVLARVGYSLKNTQTHITLLKVDKLNHRHVQAPAKSWDHPNQSAGNGRENTTNLCSYSSMGVRSPNSPAKHLEGEQGQSY